MCISCFGEPGNKAITWSTNSSLHSWGDVARGDVATTQLLANYLRANENRKITVVAKTNDLSNTEWKVVTCLP